jgi:hypothetical protein
MLVHIASIRRVEEFSTSSLPVGVHYPKWF